MNLGEGHTAFVFQEKNQTGCCRGGGRSAAEVADKAPAGPRCARRPTAASCEE